MSYVGELLYDFIILLFPFLIFLSNNYEVYTNYYCIELSAFFGEMSICDLFTSYLSVIRFVID